jgi:hypothetical protein
MREGVSDSLYAFEIIKRFGAEYAHRVSDIDSR